MGDTGGMSTQTAPRPTAPFGQGETPEGPRWKGLAVKIGLAVVVVVGLAIAKPAIIQGILGSPRAIAIVLGIIAATIGWSALLRRFNINDWMRGALVLLPLAMIAGFYIAPYFGPDQVVDEEFPAMAVAADTASTAAEGPDSTAIDGQPADTQPAGGTQDDSAELGVTQPDVTEPGVAEPAPVSPPESQADGPDAADGSAVDPGAAEAAEPAQPEPAQPEPAQPEPAQPAPPAEPVEPAGPVQLSTGTFAGLDGHYANGVAALYDLGEGQRIVRLEDVDLQRVPEPFVYLVPGAGATSPTSGSVNLGALKGNVGSSNYEVPADYDLSGPVTVLVWCEPFASPVGAATQS